jgi:hypothetical protein
MCKSDNFRQVYDRVHFLNPSDNEQTFASNPDSEISTYL